MDAPPMPGADRSFRTQPVAGRCDDCGAVCAYGLVENRWRVWICPRCKRAWIDDTRPDLGD
jgi:predicted Zn-ribbon and HTH transcriptional regulator